MSQHQSFFSAGLPDGIAAASFDLPSQPSPAVVDLNCLIIGPPDTAEPAAARPSDAPEQATVSAPQKADILTKVVELLERAKKAHKSGDLGLLKQIMFQIVEIDPENGLAHFNLGVLFRDAKDFVQAEVHLRKAAKFDPTNPLYHLALGELMLMMRHLLFAAEAYEKALALAPNDLKILASLTDVRQRQRMPRQVADLSRRSLALDPQSVKAMLNLTVALLWLGEAEEAAETIDRALALDPTSIIAAALSQVALKRLGREEAATAVMADIEQRATVQWDLCMNATEMFQQVDEAEAAVHLLRKVIAQKPDFVPALQLLGRYMILDGDPSEGLALMSRVVELNPDEGDAQTSVALTLIRNGNFEEGWARHHWRWHRTGCEPRWDLPMPEWDGRPIDDGGVLLWREQGIGDMVMYAAPALACRHLAKSVTLETNPRLRTLLKRSFPDMSVICREDMPADFFATSNIKAQCPIGDLPHILKLDMGAYPGRDGFLTAHPAEVGRLRERYQLLYPGKRLIGISWRSGNSASAVTRSVDLMHWMPIFETADCAFVSLQYGDISKDVNLLREETGIEVYIDSEVNAMQDMDRFAAQIAAVDLVISVDNSTVHVAGALGKTTWVFVPSSADWRWLTPEHTDTIWYRSLTLFRQEPQSDWSPQVNAVASQLRALTQQQLDDERQALYLRCAQQSLEYGDANTAELYFRRILATDRDHHPSLAGLGRVALQTRHLEDAIGLLRRATEGAPDRADYYRDLAKALFAAERPDQALVAIRRALEIDGTDLDALTLGIEILRQLGNSEEAANYCARILRLDPLHREARLHLAQLQASAGDFDVAEANFQRVLLAHPDDAKAAFSLGCLALRREDLVAGWSGYSRRFEAGLPLPPIDLNLPDLAQLWDLPEEMSMARVAVRPEPSLKDQLMFLRWLPALRQDVAFVTAELDPRVVHLVDQRATRLSLYPTGSLTKEDADDLNLSAQIALGDLGARYGRDISRLNEAVPYLQFDRQRANTFRHDYLQALKAERLIGICWRGGEMAIPLIDWLPILQTKGFGFISLQAGPAQQELHDVFNGLGMSAIRDPSIDPQSNLRGFAAQVAAVDLVISIDEVPAHLAGALGVPTLCLLPQVADWRWFGVERTDSPWYPTMQLYRQGADGSWSTIMQQVAADVQALAEQSEKEGDA
jgi:tetratricopeptide (TPR) repeat protein